VSKLLEDFVYRAGTAYQELSCFNVLLTRFNARTGYAAPPTDTWLEHRLEIFQRVCLPSVAAQRRRPDAWLLLFDGSGPERVEPVIRLLEPYSWIVPVWQPSRDGRPEPMAACFAREIEARLPKQAQHLITTRLDNDDALGVDYLKLACDYSCAVVEQDRSLDDFWISFPIGAQLHGEALRLYVHSRSHFMTRCQTVSQFQASAGETVVSIRHGDVFHAGRRVFSPLTDQPVWLQVVHDRNVSNKERKEAPLIQPVSEVKRWFAISVG